MTDILVQVIILGVVLKRRGHVPALPIIGGILSLLWVLLLTHMGCQQRQYQRTADPDRPKELLDVTLGLCPHADNIRYTRFWGAGTFNLCIALLIIYLFKAYPPLETTGPTGTPDDGSHGQKM